VFDIRQSIHDSGGELDEEKAHTFTRHLIKEFAESPEAQPLIERSGGVGGWVDMMFHYYFHHVGGTLEGMKPRDLREVLFEVFPRKVSTEPDSAPEIVAELRAFWQFLQRQYQLPAAADMVALLDDKAESRLRAELGNPANWGMAKSFFMQGQQAGFDMTTKEGSEAFMTLYNLGQMAKLGVPPPELGQGLGGLGDIPYAPPSPLTHQEKAKKRKERKAERQARKRNRRK
jgi:hypothetical protein